ncbi:MAG: conserved rane protein of unknown function [Parcubacteria group bacterium]|nr:conserved rane protein of unknown function [Parcubacteria group bacterium]
MKTTLLLAALFILVLGGGYLWKGGGSLSVANSYNTTVIATSSGTQNSSATTTTTKAVVATTKVSDPGMYTQAQVATHNTSNSCWAIINGNVYDLTKWIPQHPGGEGPILSLCGKDGTSMFEAQHSNNGRANAELATLKIGTLGK